MKILLIFALSLISGGATSKQVMGYSGGGVLIKCKYKRDYTSNQKYFCKSSWTRCDDQIKTGDKNKWVNTGRFSLFDTSSAEFWVLIRDLTVEDSGKYQCGVDKELDIDIYTPVELNVLDELSHEKSITVTGQEGGGVNISCKHPESLSSEPKFLCRMGGTDGCNYKTSVKDSRRWIKEGKRFLYDNRAKKIFNVSLSDLSEGDSGEYWCGAESDWEYDHGYKVYFTQIHLTVTGQKTLPTSTSSSRTSSASKTSLISSMENASTGFSASSVIIIVSAILVLLLIGLLLLTLILRKKTQASAPRQSPVKASNKLKVSLDVSVYDAIKGTTPLPASDTGVSTLYSTAELAPNLSEAPQIVYDNVQSLTGDFSNPIYSSAQLPSNPPGQDVYSTAPQLPRSHSDSSARGPQHSAGQSTEGPTYATVNFNKNTGRSGDAVTTATLNKEDFCDYATVKYVSGSG